MAAGWGVKECIRTTLEDILQDVGRWFPWVCWFRLLVRVRISGAAVVAVVDGEGLMLSLVVEGGLFKLALWRSVLVVVVVKVD